MSDDRELVERLAAIDVTPRASWVAEMRADLDAAWETGHTDSRDSLHTTTLTLIDHEPTPTQPSSGRGWPILIAAAAAVIVAIALVATRDEDATPADQPAPILTVPPTTPPRALFGTYDEQLLPGTYFLDEVGRDITDRVETTPTPRISLTIGEGWSNFGDDWGVVKEGIIVFSRPEQVFSDACHWSDGVYPGSVATLGDLVAALSGQGGWADVTVPSDITIDGYAGKAFQRTVPASISDCTILDNWGPRLGGHGSYPAFRSWAIPDPPPYEQGQIETVWVLDLDGTVVVINARPFPEASAAARAEFAAVLDSIRIDPADQPSPTVIVPRTVPPRALPDSIPPGERLVPGTYFVDEVEGTPTPRIHFTIGAGWTDMHSDQATDSYGSPSFSHPGAVFKDACHWEDGYYPGPLTTLDGLVAALTEQEGWADVTAPSDISVDGYAGKAFQRTVPADISDCDTMSYGPRHVPQADRGKMLPAFRSWQIEKGELTPDTGGNLAGFGYEAGMIETVWVLDLDGTVVVINSRPVPEASAADRAVFAAVLDSIRIEKA